MIPLLTSTLEFVIFCRYLRILTNLSSNNDDTHKSQVIKWRRSGRGHSNGSMKHLGADFALVVHLFFSHLFLFVPFFFILEILVFRIILSLLVLRCIRRHLYFIFHLKVVIIEDKHDRETGQGRERASKGEDL